MTENNPINEFDPYFCLSLDCFEGPIDLLLHLVKKNELEITSLSLSQICGQYLECIDVMRQLDLELAGEYLVIAATLLSIKSSLMLNKPVELTEDEDGNLVNPHDELLARLKEAEIYKEGATQLGELDYLGLDVFQGKSQLKKYESVDMGFAEHDSYLLGKAFYKALRRLEDQKVYQIVLESVSIVDRMSHVMDRLSKNNSKLSFQNLVEDINSKGSLIGTFLALLELCKRQIISVKQDDSEEEIFVCLAGEDLSYDLDSEFDMSIERKEIA